MTPDDLEAVYEALALRLDTVPPDRRELYLAKLALLLSREIGTAARVLPLVAAAAEDLDA